jgi:hypothetical protein
VVDLSSVLADQSAAILLARMLARVKARAAVVPDACAASEAYVPLTLPEPALEMSLHCDALVQAPAPNAELFPRAAPKPKASRS